ncbi:MAG: alpha/beta hydrolase [Oligoflexia bacterium]|nr:alpha/beta hydrolase [Oligoflexia bacterium]
MNFSKSQLNKSIEAAGTVENFLARAWDSPLTESQQFYLDLWSEKGTTILLIHGLNTDSASYQQAIPYFSNKARILAPDLRLHGKSSNIGSIVTLETFAQDLKLLLDHKKINSVVLVGHSLGARIALKLAAKIPEKIKALFLEDMLMHSYKPTTSFKTVLECYEVAEKFKNLKNHYDNREELQAHLEKFFSRDEAKRFATVMGNNGPNGSVKIGNAASHKFIDLLTKWEDLSSTIHQYNGPIYLLKANPKVSRFCPMDKVEELQKRKGFTKIIPFYKAGHSIHEEIPKKFARTILKELGLRPRWKFW